MVMEEEAVRGNFAVPGARRGKNLSPAQQAL
jgi:hypothetical protein